jgi:uncharacterized UBP type Zn finger protein
MCQHLIELLSGRAGAVSPSARGCEDCLRAGDGWVHLRLCLTCGHVGCCDSSPNRHATRHFHASGHPVVKSFEPGEAWAWCYRHQELVDDIPAFPEETPAEHYPSAGDGS